MICAFIMALALAAFPNENQQPVTIPASFGKLSHLDQRIWKEECQKINALMSVLYEAARDSTVFDMTKMSVPELLQLTSRVQRQAWHEETRNLNEAFFWALEALRTRTFTEPPKRLAMPSMLSDMSAFDQQIWKEQIAKINEAFAFFYERVRGL